MKSSMGVTGALPLVLMLHLLLASAFAGECKLERMAELPVTKIAWSLYGRGLARLQTGNSAEGDADLAAAAAIDPHLPEKARKYGIGPW